MSYFNSIFNGIKNRKIASDGSFTEKILEPAADIYGGHTQLILQNISPHIIAIHLTVIDLDLFKKITFDELYNCQWTKSQIITSSSNVAKMTRQFNNICYFIIAEILRHKTPKTRARIIDYFIKVAKKLFSLNNINSMKSIISALQSSPIYRLRDSFELLSKKNIDLFQKYEKFFSEDNNRKQLRSHIDTSQIPCIPYLGIYLTDLIYVDSLYPTLETQHKERLERMCCIIKSIQKFQESKYEFVDINPQLIDFFLKDRYIDELKKFVDDRFYQVSLELEPSVSSKTPPISVKAHSRKSCKSDSINSINFDNFVPSKGFFSNIIDDSSFLSTPSYVRLNTPILQPSPKNIKRPKGIEALSEINNMNIVYEGYLKRRVIVKQGENYATYDHKNLWVILTTNRKLVHVQINTPFLSCVCTTSTTTSSQPLFHKTDDISNYCVRPVLDNKKCFLLMTKDQHIVNRYQAKSIKEGEEWFNHLSIATSLPDEISFNLMTFDTIEELQTNPSDTTFH